MDSPPKASAARNARPKRVEAFLVEGETHDLWYGANMKSNRFFIVNLDRAIQSLEINHTKLEAYFKKAETAISEETDWIKQFGFQYKCSHTQIYPLVRGEAKTFDKAATIIVALELYAAERKTDYNVYDELRILPAQYFVDRLDKERIAAIKDWYRDLPKDQRVTRLGASTEDTQFGDLVLDAIEQPNCKELLQKHSVGHTLTKYTATRLQNFINENFPREFNVGPVLSAGESPSSATLGRKSVVPDLRVPKRMDVSAFPLM